MSDGNPSAVEVALTALDPAVIPDAAEDRRRIDEIKRSVDLGSITGVLAFGTASEQAVARFADTVLEQVLGKDLGPVHDRLAEIRGLARGIAPEALQSKGLFGRFFFDLAREVTRFAERFQTARAQIDGIAAELDDRIHELSLGLVILDRLFAQNLANFRELTLHIVAGHEVLAQVRAETLPEAERLAEAEAASPDGAMLAQRARDLRAAADRLDRKVMNLEKSKAIAHAAMPTIRQAQQTGLLLIEELKTALAHAIPAWKSTMIVQIEQFRQRAGIAALSAMTDFTNEQLRAMAAQLGQNVELAHQQSQRGIADVAAITDAIGALVTTLDRIDGLETEARAARADGRIALAKAEHELKARQAGTGTGA